MTAHVQRFVERVRSAEHRGQREVVLSLSEAKDLHADITKLLAVIQELHEQARTAPEAAPQDAEISGGTF